MRKLTYLLVVVLIAGISDDVFGQMNRRQIKRNNRQMMNYRGKKAGFAKEKQYINLGLTLNALNYYGDLAPKPSRFSTDLSFTRPAVGLSMAKRLGPRFSLAGSFLYGSLKGSDSKSADENDTRNGVYRFQRNLSFRNRIKELSVIASMDLWENQSTYISRQKWTPFAYAGISVFHHNPQAKVPATQLDGTPFPNSGQWVNLRELGTEGQHANLLEGDVNHGNRSYKNIQFAIPMGIGVRFRLNEVMDFSAEFGFRYLFTDYIDDVSGNYVDLGVFGNNELAKALSYRGGEINPSNTITYSGRDGVSYNVISGYGMEHPENLRGNKEDKDIFTVTTLRLTYIMGKAFRRPKFR